MKWFSLTPFATLVVATFAADGLTTRNPNPVSAGTSTAAALDPVRDLPRHAPVEPDKAVATWKVRDGFALELVAHEPAVRDPIALTFDEYGRMFVCEMIDYSERRDVTPHLGRISMLEDKDGDGIYETNTVFAEDLPLPTGLIWANGGLFVAATPDIWRFEDRDGDGRAEVRNVAFTGFGRGLRALNVQAMVNSFAWGPDNRVHVQGGPGNRGVISSPQRPDLRGEEIGGRDFWFDPLTLDFGFEAGGGQYGLSFDDYGRRFVSSNSDHLQFYVYDDRYARRNPFFTPPSPRQSIAIDGGAAEVFRISPDEPWRIVRTRWRIGGVVRGIVEGGGRVSGYFTGATGTTVYRGDAYGPDFANNTFTGDAGGQLIHRKYVVPNGASLVGRRPDDEQDYEFAASTDPWVRVVNFANAPDGTLFVCDMYREVIEHPWSLPEEIKRHLDLNSGHDRGRIYRIISIDSSRVRRPFVLPGDIDSAGLVALLAHPNGWHRDTAARLLYERQDRTVIPLLLAMMQNEASGVARQHALNVLAGFDALSEEAVLPALSSGDPRLRERAVLAAESLLSRSRSSPALASALRQLVHDPDPRVRLQLAFTLSCAREVEQALVDLARRDHADPWISAALLTAPPVVLKDAVLPAFTADRTAANAAPTLVARLVEIVALSAPDEAHRLIDFLSAPDTNFAWLRAFGSGLQRAGRSLEAVDQMERLAPVFTRAAMFAADGAQSDAARCEALRVLEFAPFAQALKALKPCLAGDVSPVLQATATEVLMRFVMPEATTVLLEAWNILTPSTRDVGFSALLAREDRLQALLSALSTGTLPPSTLSASQIQALAAHRDPATAQKARTVLAGALPRSREQVAAQFQPALSLLGDANAGRDVYRTRCYACHRAAGEGLSLGPDLATTKSRGRDALLSAILDPHREVAPQYIAYDVTTRDGQTHTGLIVRDDASGLTLKLVGGAEISLPRAQLAGTTSAGLSLMPEGLESGLSIEDLANLMTFIENL